MDKNTIEEPRPLQTDKASEAKAANKAMLLARAIKAARAASVD